MKLTESQLCKQVVQKLNNAYSAEGREALFKMSTPEAQVLLGERLAELTTVSKKLSVYPHDELSQMRKGQLEHSVSDIAAFLKERSREEWKERGPNEPEMDR